MIILISKTAQATKIISIAYAMTNISSVITKTILTGVQSRSSAYFGNETALKFLPQSLQRTKLPDSNPSLIPDSIAVDTRAS